MEPRPKIHPNTLLRGTKMNRGTSRRDYLKMMAASAGLAAVAPLAVAQEGNTTKPAPQPGTPPDHDGRMKWWHEAKFGMFIHWGLYSVIGRHE
jgi:alpha-L-fucosidase